MRFPHVTKHDLVRIDEATVDSLRQLETLTISFTVRSP